MARRKKKSETRTLVAIVLDKSYSMMDRRAETISAMNEYINVLKTDGEGEILATMIQFDNPSGFAVGGGGPRFEETYVNQPLKSVPRLDNSNYKPRGSTPLYDAIGHVISRVEEEDTGKDEKVIVVIMTDGLENASRQHTKASIMELRDRKEADGWEFVYLGAGEQAWAGGRALGFRSTQTVNYGTLDKKDHTDAVYLAASASVDTTHSLRGAGASESFLSVSPEKSRLEGKAKTGTKRPRSRTTK